MRNFITRLWRPALALFIGVLLAGCEHRDENAYHGYAEGEYVYLGSSQAGTLTRLQVARGQTVKAGASLFALDSVDETAALRQAYHAAVREGRSLFSKERFAEFRKGNSAVP